MFERFYLFNHFTHVNNHDLQSTCGKNLKKLLLAFRLYVCNTVVCMYGIMSYNRLYHCIYVIQTFVCMLYKRLFVCYTNVCLYVIQTFVCMLYKRLFVCYTNKRLYLCNAMFVCIRC